MNAVIVPVVLVKHVDADETTAVIPVLYVCAGPGLLLIDAAPLAGNGTHANGVTAPSAGALVALNTSRKPPVFVRLVAYTPYKLPAEPLRTWLLSPEVETTGVMAPTPLETVVTGIGFVADAGTALLLLLIDIPTVPPTVAFPGVPNE